MKLVTFNVIPSEDFKGDDMEKIEWNGEQKAEFQRLLREFVRRIDVKIEGKDRTLKGMETSDLKKDFNLLLNSIGYECDPRFGQGTIAGSGNANFKDDRRPSIVFCRQDILKEHLVNGTKLKQSEGFYIWFAYYWRDPLVRRTTDPQDGFHLCIGRAEGSLDECKRCLAYEPLFVKNPEGFNEERVYPDLEPNLEKITDYFLELVSIFNAIPVEHFRPINNLRTLPQQIIAIPEKIPMNNSPKIPLNQILYGPPGTGKTYNTINKALEILGHDTTNMNRKETKALFDQYKQEGRIDFVTFHQSYGYEEFVEGIKPEMDSEQESSEQVRYKVEDGIFKRMCQKALKNYQDSLKTDEAIAEEIGLEELLEEYAQNIQNKLDQGEVLNFHARMKIKAVCRSQKGDFRSIRLGTDGSDVSAWQSLTKDVLVRDYLDFKNGKIHSYKDIKPTYESQSKMHGNAPYYYVLLTELKKFEETKYKSEIQQPLKAPAKQPYILIIDEINRGNISKICGELITLIEESKRIGNSEALRITLPYSKESFGVPDNLYIIGTMNTADRSIALLDTALRRRFTFVEMMPNPALLGDCEGVDLSALLEAMNARIEFLLDNNHTIGHSYFLGLKDLESLQECFKNKIIPLLQEYFYDDHAKVSAVLNGNGMLEVKEVQKMGAILGKLVEDFVDMDKKVYHLTESKGWRAEQFQAIYGGTKQNEGQTQPNEPSVQNANP